MTKMPYIKWERQYSVHVDILDEQHRKLFDIINDLIDDIDLGEKNLFPIIQDLVDYLSVHFHQEHIVMMNSNYPGFSKHSSEHQKFTEKVEEFLASYQEGDEELGKNMILFMRSWIYTHTTKLDIQYGEHLLRNADDLGHSGKVKLNL